MIKNEMTEKEFWNRCHRKLIFDCNKLPKGDLQFGLGFSKETLHTYEGEPIPEYTIFISLFKWNIYFGIGVVYDEK